MPPLNRQEIIREAKDKYRKMKADTVFSPALNNEIRFTNRGWNHLVHNGREFNDVYRRIKLLPLVKEIISTKKSFKEGRVWSNSYIVSAIRSMVIRNKQQKRMVKILILLDRNNEYTFFSVCDKPLKKV